MCGLAVQDMTYKLLHNFNRKNRKLPGQIIFYRDGVSEGQFKEVLQAEVPPHTLLLRGPLPHQRSEPACPPAPVLHLLG
jgi:hypothetical protein